MPSQFKLTATTRTVPTPQKNRLRREGKTPAVVYGHGTAPQHLLLDSVEFKKVYAHAGASALVELAMDDAAPRPVIIQEVQYDPLGKRVLHVDLHQVRMTEKMHAKVPLVVTGESPAVKALGGILVKNFDHLEIECLPSDLVHEIILDISTLSKFHQPIHISDLSLPIGIVVRHPHAGEVLITVEPPRSEAELAALSEKVEEDVTKVETVEKKLKEEEGAEGEEAKGEKGKEAKPAAGEKGGKKEKK